MCATPTVHMSSELSYLQLHVLNIHWRHRSERSQAESRLRSQLEASARNNERLHADVRALTAEKCELDAEVELYSCRQCSFFCS